jgi:hypothetical protein
MEVSMSDMGFYLYCERLNQRMICTIDEGLSSSPDKKMPWHTISINRIQKIWRDYVTLGIVRDEKGVDEIVNDFVNKIIQIDINTTLYGHTSSDPKSSIKEVIDIEISEEELERIQNYVETEEGQWRISDYALPKLQIIAINLLEETDYENKVLLLDSILNTVHQRSDLASWFIEGGRSALDKLSGKEDK